MLLLQWCFVFLVFQLNIYVNHGQSCLLQSYISNGLRCPRLSITPCSIFNKYTIIYNQKLLDLGKLVCQVFFILQYHSYHFVSSQLGLVKLETFYIEIATRILNLQNLWIFYSNKLPLLIL